MYASYEKASWRFPAENRVTFVCLFLWWAGHRALPRRLFKRFQSHGHIYESRNKISSMLTELLCAPKLSVVRFLLVIKLQIQIFLQHYLKKFQNSRNTQRIIWTALPWTHMQIQSKQYKKEYYYIKPIPAVGLSHYSTEEPSSLCAPLLGTDTCQIADSCSAERISVAPRTARLLNL